MLYLTPRIFFPFVFSWLRTTHMSREFPLSFPQNAILETNIKIDSGQNIHDNKTLTRQPRKPNLNLSTMGAKQSGLGHDCQLPYLFVLASNLWPVRKSQRCSQNRSHKMLSFQLIHLQLPHANSLLSEHTWNLPLFCMTSPHHTPFCFWVSAKHKWWLNPFLTSSE